MHGSPVYWNTGAEDEAELVQFLKEFGQLEPVVRSFEERYINLWQRIFKEDKMEFFVFFP